MVKGGGRYNDRWMPGEWQGGDDSSGEKLLILSITIDRDLQNIENGQNNSQNNSQEKDH